MGTHKHRAVAVLMTVCVLALAWQATSRAGVLGSEFEFGTEMVNGREVGYFVQGIPTTLTGTPNCDWWYGCSPTSAGMMIGFYDRNGYGSPTLYYPNLVPGGVAELNTFGNPTALVNSTIASAGHIADFYPGGNGASGDDVSPPFHTFNSLADFMDTSQDSAGTSNGTTLFHFWPNGTPYTSSDAATDSHQGDDGMYGIGEYVTYAGYSWVTSPTEWLFTQLTDNDALGYGFTGGFTFNDYKSEIDNGRPVLVHVTEHTMCGYGYDDTNPQNPVIFVYDTWDDNDGTGSNQDGQNPGVMPWGGKYGSRDLIAVTCLELTGGSEGPDNIPEPVSMSLLGGGLIALIVRRRRSKRAA